MADIDLRLIHKDDLVLHFGGRTNEIDAFTFSNSLISISQAIQEVNRQLNPEHSIQISIEALGSGSFRAKINTASRRIAGLFRGVPRDIIVGIAAAFIYEKFISDGQPKIIVQDDSYIIESGGDRIILPKLTGEAKQRLPAPERVQEHISRTFGVLAEDPSVENFGIAEKLTDLGPITSIPKDAFSRLSMLPAILEGKEERRHKDERTHLAVVKAVFERSRRKWEFVWNSIRISAVILDIEFFDALANRKYVFAQGDVLEVTLRVHQAKDEMTGVYVNEKYEVLKVHKLIPRPRQGQLI